MSKPAETLFVLLHSESKEEGNPGFDYAFEGLQENCKHYDACESMDHYFLRNDNTIAVYRLESILTPEIKMKVEDV